VLLIQLMKEITATRHLISHKMTINRLLLAQIRSDFQMMNKMNPRRRLLRAFWLQCRLKAN